MRNIRLDLEYEGGRYHGWQIQPNALTVQQVLEETLERILVARPRVLGAGRTDAGVHALGQVANFLTENPLEPQALRRALNSLLPEDIVAKEVREVPHSFHARKSVQMKRYEYYIWRAYEASAFCNRFCWHLRMPLKIEEMVNGARHFLGEHDFVSLQASGAEPGRSTVRTLEKVEVEPLGEFWLRISVEGKGFLRQMVRILVGTLVEVGMGRISESDLPGILSARDRTKAGRTAPARGLFLTWIQYQGEGTRSRDFLPPVTCFGAGR